MFDERVTQLATAYQKTVDHIIDELQITASVLAELVQALIDSEKNLNKNKKNYLKLKYKLVVRNIGLFQMRNFLVLGNGKLPKCLMSKRRISPSS